MNERGKKRERMHVTKGIIHKLVAKLLVPVL